MSKPPTDQQVLHLLRAFEEVMDTPDAIEATAFELSIPTERVRDVLLWDELGAA